MGCLPAHLDPPKLDCIPHSFKADPPKLDCTPHIRTALWGDINCAGQMQASLVQT